MSKIKLLPLLTVGLLGACQGAQSTPIPPDGSATDDAHSIGALHVSAPVPDASVDSVEYTVISGSRTLDLTGTLSVAEGVAQGQIRVPQGKPFDVQLRFLAGAVERCEGQAKDLAVESGRTSQVNILPLCGQAEVTKDRNGKRNHAPRIEAVFASRRNVRFGETVAISVAASDQDGDPLRYKWTESVAGSGFADASAAATAWKAGPRSVARNTIRTTVTDGRNGSASASLDMDFEPLALTPGTCAAPTPIQIGDTIRGFTVGSPSQQAPIDCFFEPDSPAPEHVFKLELTEPQDVSISVAGSAFFARVYVRRDQCDSVGAEIACDEFEQRVDLLNAEPGSYFVFVDGGNRFDAGEYVLSVLSGTPSEVCRNFTDDDADGLVDCADPDCADEPGCLDCAFECDPDPNDCIGGQCDRFSGRCNTFFDFGGPCDSDGNPQTSEACGFDGECVATECGNAIIEPGEQCDDGNTVSGDGCEDCLIVAVCGNGFLEFPEECDDGNTVGGDGCEADCRVIPVCGNGIFEGEEECEDGNTQPGDGCDASCRFERCGRIICADGNPCTLDSCEDPTTSNCEFTPIGDGTSCELDGLPDTLEQCQAGLCAPLPPDHALVILDPAVLSDAAFSLRAMHDRLATDGEGSLLFDQWATTLTIATTVNGRTVTARPGFTTFFDGLARDANGRTDLDLAGFLPSAFVNRFDLRTTGNCGENRLVFTKASGLMNGNDRMTLIFEFNVPDDGSDCRNAVARWTALRTLQGDALRTAAATLLEQIALPLEINTLRTNEFINAPIWELREFHLVDGQLLPATVVDSVPFELAQDPTFRSFVVQNAATLNHGSREIGIIPSEFLGAASHSDGNILALGNIVPSIPGLESNLNVLSCSGCHLTQTGTDFVHVTERTPDQPSRLSTFMRSELEFRGRTLDAFLTQ